MTRRRRLVLLVALVLALALVALPFAFPRLGLELWRSGTRLLAGAECGTRDVAGRSIAWCELGEGEPIFLLHGLRGEMPVMLELAGALSERGRRVALIDLPGHGRSAPPNEELDIARAGAIVDEALASFDLPSDTPVVAHSLGAWIVAWRALARPEDAGPSVLVSPPGVAFEMPPMPVLVPRDAREAARSMDYMFGEPRWAPWPIRHVAVARRADDSLDMLASALSGEYLLDGLLEGCARPMLVVHGERDRLIPPEVGREIAARCPLARYVGVPGTGHMVVWEKPEAVADAVIAFLDEQEAGRASPAAALPAPASGSTR